MRAESLRTRRGTIQKLKLLVVAAGALLVSVLLMLLPEGPSPPSTPPAPVPPVGVRVLGVVEPPAVEVDEPGGLLLLLLPVPAELWGEKRCTQVNNMMVIICNTPKDVNSSLHHELEN